MPHEIGMDGPDFTNRPEVVNPAEELINIAVDRARRSIMEGISSSSGLVPVSSGGPADITTTTDEDGATVFGMIWGVDNWGEANWTES